MRAGRHELQERHELGVGGYNEWLKSLDDDLVKIGAAFDIVDLMPFSMMKVIFA